MTIDINCDLGEGGSFDEALMPLISSCNIACGGHYGNQESVHSTVALAKAHNVKVGAHPSYPDLANFGRQSIHMSATELKRSLHEQIDLVETACLAEAVKWHHIKPHGALYNDMHKKQSIADLVLEVCMERQCPIILFLPPGVQFSEAVPEQIQIWKEGFADRAYHKNLSLVSRLKDKAVLHNPKQISQRVLEMILQQRVETYSGSKTPLHVDTICVHSDTPNSLKILQDLQSKLTQKGIQIRA